jgi:hypothetical protein
MPLPRLMLASLAATLSVHLLAADTPRLYEPVGGANAPTSSPPPELIVGTVVLDADGFSVKVPVGEYTAPPAGAPNYRVPGPIVAFKGTDGQWRGHGYLETYTRLKSFKGEVTPPRARLDYRFEDGGIYRVTLEAKSGVIVMEEDCSLGPRNLYVFDAYYGWQPSSAFVLDGTGERHAFLYLPCHYDRVEATVTPATNVSPSLSAAAILHPEPAIRDIAASFVRSATDWKNPDRMAAGLWQRRQLPGDPGSRHFLGPETKSDSTPNPRTAALLGTSLYEGHVTMEFNLGNGKRTMGFVVYPKPPVRDEIPAALKKIIARTESGGRQ